MRRAINGGRKAQNAKKSVGISPGIKQLAYNSSQDRGEA